MTQIIQVSNKDGVYSVRPTVGRGPDGRFRGMVLLARPGDAEPLDYECAFGRRSPDEALADASELMQRLAGALGRPRAS